MASKSPGENQAEFYKLPEEEQEILHDQAYDEAKLENEKRDISIPDFRFFFDHLEKICAETDLWDYFELEDFIGDSEVDKYYSEALKIAREANIVNETSRFGSGLISYFRMLLAADRRGANNASESLELIPELPVGGSLLEIGGPSIRNDETKSDIIFSGSKDITFANPDVYGNNELSMLSIEKLNLGKEMSLNIHSVSNLDELIDSGKHFDFITSYNVFGQESQEFGVYYDSHMWIDLSTQQKRNEVLLKIKSLLKPNGLFMNATLQTGLGFSTEELRGAGFQCPELPEPDQNRQFFAQYIEK